MKQPRPKLKIHKTERDLTAIPNAGGRVPYVLVAVVIMLVVTRLVPMDWWFPAPKTFKPVTVPIERVQATPEPVVIAEPVPVVVAEPYGPPAPEKKPLWQMNAVPIVLDPNKVHVAIVIDDMGVNVAKSREMLEMPSVLTLSFLPYAHDVAAMAEDARAKGHELMVHIPMEPMDGTLNAGDNELLVAMTPEQLKQAVEVNLSKFSGYVGVNNHMGSRFTQDEAALAELVQILKDRELTLLDSKTIAASKAFSIARGIGIPAAERDVFLDDDPSLIAVRAQLAHLEKVAASKGHAIAIGHPKADTIQALKEWLPQAAAKGIQIVPFSALVER